MSTSGETTLRSFTTRSPAETRALAARIVAERRSACVLALHGELGSGKTCFVQGLAEAVGVTDAVTPIRQALAREGL